MEASIKQVRIAISLFFHVISQCNCFGLCLVCLGVLVFVLDFDFDLSTAGLHRNVRFISRCFKACTLRVKQPYVYGFNLHLRNALLHWLRCFYALFCFRTLLWLADSFSLLCSSKLSSMRRWRVLCSVPY